MTPLRLPEAIALALVITAASHAVPDALTPLVAEARPSLTLALGYANLHDLVSLVFGLTLALSAPRESGMALGRRPDWRVAFVVLLPVAVTAVVYPRLSVRPFEGERIGLWLISPLAQSTVFMGYLYGLFSRALGAEAPSTSWRPDRALLLTGCFFALWHAPNLLRIPVGYVVFQFAYTFVALVFTGLSRRWTGVLWYAALGHMAGNAIAWASS